MYLSSSMCAKKPFQFRFISFVVIIFLSSLLSSSPFPSEPPLKELLANLVQSLPWFYQMGINKI